MNHDNNSSSSKAVRVGWGILILATLFICYFSRLGVVGFIGPDEPRYAWIARDMAETGDWVTPRLYGQPWFEKPVLYYWGAAASFKLFGISEAAARLPSAISALLSTLALAWLAWRLYGTETARWLLLLLPTTVGMIGFSHAAATDMPFSGMLTIAMVCAAVIIGLTRNGDLQQPSRTPWLALAFFGVFLGLAVLAKGPAAVILSGGAIFFWALFTKRWRDALRCLHPVAIAASCLTALPWYFLCARRNPDFFRVFIIEHNFKRFVTPEFQHVQPFWYYAPVLLVGFLPWTSVFLWSMVTGGTRLWENRSNKDSTWFLLYWAGFCVIFFSFSQSKLPGYILPAFPPSAMLMAQGLNRGFLHNRNAFRWLCVGVGVTLTILGLTATFLGGKIPIATHIQPAPLVTGFAALMFFAGICVGILGLLRRGSLAIVLAALALPAFLSLGGQEWHALDEGISARPSAERAKEHLSSAQLENATTYKLQRGPKFALNFYFHRELKEWSLPVAESYVVFTNDKGAKELEKLGVHCDLYIVIPAVETCADSIKPAAQRAGFPVAGR